MPNIKCFRCKKVFYRSPSHVCPRNYCSRKCYSFIRDKELSKKGEKTRFYTGNKRPKKWTISQTKKVSNESNYQWKGEKVSYVGLHAWVRRKKGSPDTCSRCSKFSLNKRVIQWANVDGLYHRNLDDFIALCASCHKYYDQKL